MTINPTMAQKVDLTGVRIDNWNGFQSGKNDRSEAKFSESRAEARAHKRSG
jgi:hypothetical protein